MSYKVIEDMLVVSVSKFDSLVETAEGRGLVMVHAENQFDDAFVSFAIPLVMQPKVKTKLKVIIEKVDD